MHLQIPSAGKILHFFFLYACCVVWCVHDSKIVTKVYSQFIEQWKYPRWQMTDFLPEALWVIFDKERNIIVVTHRVH